MRDARREIGTGDRRFQFQVFDCHKIPFENDTFDMVVANHVLFYCDHIEQVSQEVKRVLKPGGQFLCSTYGSSHMREVSQLVQKFDDRIVLSAERLYERFGRENGSQILESCFEEVRWESYEDELTVTEPEPLIAYVLSCHGNQGQYLSNRYSEFRNFVKKKTESGFHITKDAGFFISSKRI